MYEARCAGRRVGDCGRSGARMRCCEYKVDGGRGCREVDSQTCPRLAGDWVHTGVGRTHVS